MATPTEGTMAEEMAEALGTLAAFPDHTMWTAILPKINPLVARGTFWVRGHSFVMVMLNLRDLPGAQQRPFLDWLVRTMRHEGPYLSVEVNTSISTGNGILRVPSDVVQDVLTRLRSIVRRGPELLSCGGGALQSPANDNDNNDNNGNGNGNGNDNDSSNNNNDDSNAPLPPSQASQPSTSLVASEQPETSSWVAESPSPVFPGKNVLDPDSGPRHLSLPPPMIPLSESPQNPPLPLWVPQSTAPSGSTSPQSPPLPPLWVPVGTASRRSSSPQAVGDAGGEPSSSPHAPD